VAALAFASSCGSTSSDEPAAEARSSFCQHASELSTVLARMFPTVHGLAESGIEVRESDVDALEKLEQEFEDDARLFEEVPFTETSQADMAAVARAIAKELELLGRMIVGKKSALDGVKAIERTLTAYTSAPKGFCAGARLREALGSLGVDSLCLALFKTSALANEIKSEAPASEVIVGKLNEIARSLRLDTRLVEESGLEKPTSGDVRSVADGIEIWASGVERTGDPLTDIKQIERPLRAILPVLESSCD
jgi:hypothetical protein